MWHPTSQQSVRPFNDVHDQPWCECGLRSKLRTSQTSANPGQNFYSCCKWSSKQNRGCDFFIWQDIYVAVEKEKATYHEAIARLRTKNVLMKNEVIRLREDYHSFRENLRSTLLAANDEEVVQHNCQTTSESEAITISEHLEILTARLNSLNSSSLRREVLQVVTAFYYY
ncbi:hypothetical protein LINPERHAP1_LOCUS8453 [Linum perenne]